ncbi:MAG: FAD-dependent oxidoreductase, partial [Candidatus Nanopelagicaceae bacterium]
MHQYQVLDNQLLTDTTRLLTLECSDENTPLLFQPGQYAAVGLRDKLRPTVMRCFSITSSPTNQQILQFSMRVKGRYTSALQRLKKGDKIAVRGPFGGFVFNQHTHDNVVFFAGGIGIAPFISMIRYASELHLATPIHLIYSCRNQNDIPFIKELTNLQHKNPHLTVSYVIGEGPSTRLVGAKVISGKIDNSNLSRLNLNFKQQTFFVCGPPPYMNAIFQLLKDNGAPNSKVL